MRYPDYDGAEAYEATKAHLKERGWAETGTHTDGPWVAEPAELVAAPMGPGDNVFFVIARGGGPVAAWAYTEADARLIAAAPELLREAKAAADWLEELGKDPMALRTAIAKAEGTDR